MEIPKNIEIFKKSEEISEISASLPLKTGNIWKIPLTLGALDAWRMKVPLTV